MSALELILRILQFKQGEQKHQLESDCRTISVFMIKVRATLEERNLLFCVKVLENVPGYSVTSSTFSFIMPLSRLNSVLCSTHSNGPKEWKDVSANCGQKKQSPINVITHDAKFDSKLEPFKFEGYDQGKTLTLKNNGHSAQLGLDSAMKISGGGLSGTYTATQLHFHWGSKDKPGSEHTLNGKQYPIELHIVHQQAARSDPSGGSTATGGLAVLGFFFTEGKDNEHYSNLIGGLSKIVNLDSTTTISDVKLKDLIPAEEELKLFYRYEGSLTTPLCNETVTWTVFPAPIELGKSQIEAFYTNLKYSDDKLMTDNFRPIQKLNERTIYTSGVDAILPYSRYLLISLLVFYLTSVS
ncbi:carbonic anhydrase 4 [Bufo gargarizans]|uniref:carbonic anhydrase 4 n=1 Tax=Bufo gargarizans TaxID=30331 RepID=UPI001CF51526|nr:carbonic anhydrase 4 [Bufo gargarizans]